MLHNPALNLVEMPQPIQAQEDVRIDMPTEHVQRAPTAINVQRFCNRNFVNLAIVAMLTAPSIHYIYERVDLTALSVALIMLGISLGYKPPEGTTDLARVIVRDSTWNTRTFANLTLNAGKQGFRITKAILSNLNTRNLGRICTIVLGMYRATKLILRGAQLGAQLGAKILAPVASPVLRLSRGAGQYTRETSSAILLASNHLAEGVGIVVAGTAKVASQAIVIPATLVAAPLNALNKVAYTFPKVIGYIALVMTAYLMISNYLSAE